MKSPLKRSDLLKYRKVRPLCNNPSWAYNINNLIIRAYPFGKKQFQKCAHQKEQLLHILYHMIYNVNVAR